MCVCVCVCAHSPDVDECAEKLDDCSDKQECVNINGAYMCKCNERFPRMVNNECKGQCVQGDRTVSVFNDKSGRTCRRLYMYAS